MFPEAVTKSPSKWRLVPFRAAGFEPERHKMALRARQEQQLHLAIALYLESKFPEAHRIFEQEAHIDVSMVEP